MLAALVGNLLPAVVALIVGRTAVAAAAAAPAIAAVDKAEVMHSVSEELEADCMATRGVAVARGMAPGELRHQGTQARLLDLQMPAEKTCSCFGRRITVKSRARWLDRVEVKKE